MRLTESETIELKQEITSEICKEILAFANTKGGTLYVGIADDGTVVGVADIDQATQQIGNMVRDAIKPDITMFVRYSTQRMAKKDILVVTVQRGTALPYYLASKGMRPSGVYVRQGVSSVPATDEAIRRMIRVTDGDRFEDMRALEQQLTFRTAQEAFQKRGIAFDRRKMRTLGLLSNDDVYTNLALLLSDQCPISIKTAAFTGVDMTRFQDRREFAGSLLQQMDELYDYLDMHNQLHASFAGLYRTDTRDYPEEALREALLNTIVHRDYTLRASTRINIFDDRIEFVSVGGLADGITQADIYLGFSIARNEKLANIFYRLQLIEAYGTGIPKIMDAYKGNAQTPKIEIAPNTFKVTLPNRNAVQNQHSQPAEMHPSRVCEESATYARKRATTSQRLPATSQKQPAIEKILDHLSTHPCIKRSEVDVLLQTSLSTSTRILQEMVKRGLLFTEGKGKNTVYRKTACYK